METPDDPHMVVLLQRLESLEAEVASLRRTHSMGQVAEPKIDADAHTDEPVIEITSTVTRRGWMKAAAAAAVGGTAVAVTGGEPVAAAPTTFQLGTINTNGDRTEANYTGSGAGMAVLFQDGTPLSGTTSAHPGALGGWTNAQARATGVFGYTAVQDSTAHGVVGMAVQSPGTGVLAKNTHPSGLGLRAIGGEQNGGVGVRATGNHAVRAHGEALGLFATGTTAATVSGTTFGLTASGNRCSILLGTNNDDPLGRSDMHSAGEVDATSDGVGNVGALWFCVETGSPGDWRKLAGKDSSGVLHAIAPARVYDSRRPAPSPGSISAGGSRVVSVKDGRDEASGAVIAADVVPMHARAVAYNVTLDQTVAAGFLAVVPGDVTSSAASSINWSASGLILANAGIVKLDGSRQVNVLCGGAGSTHFIIDITGYYL